MKASRPAREPRERRNSRPRKNTKKSEDVDEKKEVAEGDKKTKVIICIFILENISALILFQSSNCLKQRRPRKTPNKENGEAPKEKTENKEVKKPAAASPKKESPKKEAPASPKKQQDPESTDAERPARRIFDKNAIFIGNLPFSIRRDGLSSLFTDAGLKVSASFIATRRQPRRGGGKPFIQSKGFGFVEFESEADQEKAVKLFDGKEVDGRNVVVKKAEKQDQEHEE